MTTKEEWKEMKKNMNLLEFIEWFSIPGWLWILILFLTFVV